MGKHEVKGQRVAYKSLRYRCARRWTAWGHSSVVVPLDAACEMHGDSCEAGRLPLHGGGRETRRPGGYLEEEFVAEGG